MGDDRGRGDDAPNEAAVPDMADGDEEVVTATEFLAERRPMNRLMAVGLAGFAVLVVAIATLLVVALHEHWLVS